MHRPAWGHPPACKSCSKPARAPEQRIGWGFRNGWPLLTITCIIVCSAHAWGRWEFQRGCGHTQAAPEGVWRSWQRVGPRSEGRGFDSPCPCFSDTGWKSFTTSTRSGLEQACRPHAQTPNKLQSGRLVRAHFQAGLSHPRCSALLRGCGVMANTLACSPEGQGSIPCALILCTLASLRAVSELQFQAGPPQPRCSASLRGCSVMANTSASSPGGQGSTPCALILWGSIRPTLKICWSQPVSADTRPRPTKIG